jgi:hypothetical protein
MINVVQKIIDSMKAYDPTLDTAPGSNLRDLVINPLAEILKSYEKKQEEYLAGVSLSSLDALTDSERVALAYNFGVSPELGTKSSGPVQLYFREPVSITIPAGLRFITALGEYSAVSTQFFSRASFTQDLLTQEWSTPPVQLIAAENGSQTRILSGDTLSLPDSFNPRPLRVQATQNFSLGQAEETSAQFLERLRVSTYGGGLLAPDALEKRVKLLDSAVTSVTVVGAGHVNMLRDGVYNTATGKKAVYNFDYVVSGLVGTSSSRGYAAYFDDFVVTYSGLQVSFPPHPDNWDTEFSQEAYQAIYKFNDNLQAVKEQSVLIDYPFFQNLDGLILGDGRNPANTVFFPDEVRVSGGELILGQEGATLTTKSAAQIEAMWSGALDLIDNPALLTSYITQNQQYFQGPVSKSVSPVVSKPCSQHVGIYIESTMETTDASDTGEICYLTALRNDTLHMPHDGYGLAWKKQPEYLYRLDDDNYLDQALRAQDILKFTQEWGVNPETANLIGNLSTNPAYWHYNVYLVDNNILQEETFINSRSIADMIGGKNQFLQAGKAWIQKNTAYDFRIKISETLATKIWVKPATEAEYTDLNLVIDKGATYPLYIPAAGQTITSPITGIDELNARVGNIGIGVGDTAGYEWKVGSLKVYSFIQAHPQALFRVPVNLSDWTTFQKSFTINFWGWGWDPDFPDEGRVSLVIWNPGLEAWELLGQNTAAPADPLSAKKISGVLGSLLDYAVLEGQDYFVYYAASASNPERLNHHLAVHYTELTDESAILYHRGNCVDVVCHAPSAVEEGTISSIVTNNQVVVNIPYLVDISEVREELSQVSLDPQDYQIFTEDPGLDRGKDGSYRISFTPEWEGASVTVVYQYWAGGFDITSYLQNPARRSPGVSVEAKAIFPAKVSIENLFLTGVDAAVAVAALVGWVAELGNTLDRSDIINFLYSLGATFVDTDFTIQVKLHKPYYQYQVFDVQQRFTIPQNDLARFWTTSADILALNV